MEKFGPSEGIGKANLEAPGFPGKPEAESFAEACRQWWHLREFGGGSEMFEIEENGKGNWTETEAAGICGDTKLNLFEFFQLE